MNFTIKLTKIKSTEKLEGYWSNDDYIKLLELFDYTDASSLAEAELFDMLSMAIQDSEPADAAEIVLTYKLKGQLKEGQINNLAHEMLVDKVAEEYPNIALHHALFNINQLLFKAYNGKFPKTLASVIDFDLSFARPLTVTKELVLRTISDLLLEKSLLKRLFEDQLASDNEFKDAESIIWDLKTLGENSYQIISSDYWLNKEDFATEEFSGTLSDEEIFHKK